MTDLAKNPSRFTQGRGQLTLIEHALCPLDQRRSLVANLVHETAHRFADPQRHSRHAHATVFSPAGLSAHDEFYLWGLLALTLSQHHPDPEFCATPHYCLRQLGIFDSASSRGGKQYQQFAQAVERLSLVRYRCDHFYDPVRAERRKVGFGFFSYTMPLDLESGRAWRFSWDRVFFDMVVAAGGSLRFDLAVYRQLDAATRRLFLLLCKIFHRHSIAPRFDLRELAVDVLGFADSLAAKDLKQKVARCLARLLKADVIAPAEGGGFFRKRGPGEYTLVLFRGKYFSRRRAAPMKTMESPLLEPLQLLGFEEAAIRWLLRTYSQALLREWLDITLAAQERFGPSFFRKNPQAYLLDNLKTAQAGTRTPPDWWHEVRKEEMQGRTKRRADGQLSRMLGSLANDSLAAIDQVRQEMFAQFMAAGQSETTARRNSETFAREFQQRQAAKNGTRT